MATLNGLPVYSINISEDLSDKTGVDFISLVDYPAIETNWIAMGDTKKPLKFTTDEDKQLLYGPILIPDLPIYRYDKDMGEYYVVFKAETIERIVRKFQASQKTINLNYQHKEDSQLKLAVVQEIWLTGAKDKSQDFGFELPAGAAFICAHIGDKDFWKDEVKTGNVRGFSIEGFLDMEMKKSIQNSMINRDKFEVHKQSDGGADVYIDGEIAIGNYVFSNYPCVVLKNGVKEVTQYPVWQDTVVLADGTVLTLKDAKIVLIDKPTAMSKTKLSAEAKTSDGTTLKTPADAMEVGVDLVIVNADNTETAAPDGDYTLENGDVVSVVGGKITAINALELTTEEEAALQEVAMKIMKPVISKMQTEIDELKTKLANTPGAPSATAITDTPAASAATKLSTKKTLLGKLEVFRKKDKEFIKK